MTTKNYRTIRTKVYKFDALSDEAKKKAIDRYRRQTLEHGFTWDDDNNKTLEEFMKLFPVKSNWRGNGLMFSGGDDIKKLSGWRLATYLWNNYRSALFSGKYYSKNLKGRKSKCQIEHSCELTGYAMDEAILQPVYEYMNRPTGMDFEDLMMDCFESWRIAVEHDHEFQLSDEYIKEEIEANEYEFLKDGTKY